MECNDRVIRFPLLLSSICCSIAFCISCARGSMHPPFLEQSNSTVRKIITIGEIDLSRNGNSCYQIANAISGHYYFGICFKRKNGELISVSDIPSNAKISVSVISNGINIIYQDTVSISDFLQVAPIEYARKGKSLFYAYTVTSHQKKNNPIKIVHTTQGIYYSCPIILYPNGGIFSLTKESSLSFYVVVCSPDLRGENVSAEIQIRNYENCLDSGLGWQ